MDARRAWHGFALLAFALAAGAHAHVWLRSDLMPLGDFPGYSAQVQYVRDALLEHGRVPRWCVECYGGTTNFIASWKEILIFPLALAFDPLLATKLAFLVLRVAGAFGLYWLVAHELAAPAVGIAAGYAYSFGSIANHQIEHLDVATSTALLPYLWISAAALLHRGGARWAISLGLAMACALANNWVHAATAPVDVLGLALLRPWRASGDERTPWRDARLARRWMLGSLGAFAVFAAFAASPIAWLAADVRHHSLIPADVSELQRDIFVERSPFLFANRDDWLAPWLDRHQPPYGAAIADRGKRYLGGVVVAVMLASAATLRGDPVRRRWAALAGLAFAFQYWLALGPRTLLWELATSLHAPPAVQELCTWALRAGAALLAGAALWAGFGRSAGARGRELAGPTFAAALLLFLPTVSLWSACARFLPMFAAQRSPGHFFDTAPFALSLGFAACLAALVSRLARPRAAHALVAAVGFALVIDYRPSAKSFAEGRPLAPLRASAGLVADLPDEGGTARIGLGPAVSPLASWLLAQSRAGHAWGWLYWQSGEYWPDSYATAAFAGRLAEGGSQPLGERYAPLLRAARVRHLLLPDNALAPPAPWRRVRAAGEFVLYEQPEVLPFALGFPAWARWNSSLGNEASAVADALRRNVLLVAPPDDPSAADTAGAPAAPPSAAASEPIRVDYERPEPEVIRLTLDAKGAPALVFVSEGYHPWWRARVDGEPAPVWRAAIAHIAVPVAAGRHAVELRLVRPALVAAADALTAVAWIALALGGPTAWLVRRRTESRRRGARSDPEPSEV